MIKRKKERKKERTLRAFERNMKSEREKISNEFEKERKRRKN